MADVFTRQKRSEAVETRSAEFGTRSCDRGSEFPKVKLIAGDAEVIADVGDDSARHVARMPGERDEPLGAEGIRVMPVAAGGAKEFATDLAEASLQLAAIIGEVFAHNSGGEHKLVAEGGRNGSAGFQERLKVRLGGLLKAKHGFAAVAPVSVAAGKQGGFGDPDAVLVLSDLHFGKRNDHAGKC